MAPRAKAPQEIPYVPWYGAEETVNGKRYWRRGFIELFDWRQGEHVTLIGPTGTGKTTLAMALLPLRTYVIVLGTKRRDSTLQRAVKANELVRFKTWTNPRLDQNRIALWPDIRELGSFIPEQRKIFQACLLDVFRNGGWTVLADELRYMCGTLKLTREFEMLWLQGRSLDVSVVAAAQRPAWVPTSIYDQATHLFFWRDNDERNLSRIGGIGWKSSEAIRRSVSALSGHECLYINTRTGLELRTMLELSTLTPSQKER